LNLSPAVLFAQETRAEVREMSTMSPELPRVPPLR